MKPVVRFVLLTGFIGVLAVLGTFATVTLLPVPVGIPDSVGWPIVALFVLLTFLGQVAYVRVRHGATTEELNFFEAAMTAAILSMPGQEVLLAGLAGMLLAEMTLRRSAPLKIVYNVGSWGTSASVMLLLYYLAADGSDRFSTQSVMAMSAGGLLFAAWNLTALARLMEVNGGPPVLQTLREEWQLSALIGLGGVAIGMTAVALANTNLALLPFVLLPVLAVWYAYGAAAQHAEAQERNRWLVILGGSLAGHHGGRESLRDSTEAIRQIVGAPEALVLDASIAGDEASGRTLRSLADDPGPRALAPDELPVGWRTGVATRLDLGANEAGALLLGSTQAYHPSRITGRTRGWSLAEADAPVLGALVAAAGSAMRAGAAFATLTEERDKLTAVVDNASDGIAMVDDSGRIRLWSQTMARMTGVGAADLDDDLASCPPIVQTLVRASRRAPGIPGAPPAQVALVRSDGESLDVSVSTARVREATAGPESDDQGWVSILTVHDETRERRVERMKTDFIATVSHELRTPITPIKGYAHLLATRRDRFSAEQVTERLQLIVDSADHLERLVDDLITAQGVSGSPHLRVKMGVEDLSDVIRQAVAGFPQVSNRITVTLPGRPVSVQCDRDRTIQCLANLIGNADKYAPDSPIDITVHVAGERVQVHVRDHGAGIPAAEHDRVFARFYRREDPFTMRTGGAGLGLHIARELATAMGGGLTLRTPDVGTGSEFVLHLLTTEAPPVGSPSDPDEHVAPVSAIRPGQAWRTPRSGQAHPAPSDTATTSPGLHDQRAGDGTIDPSADRRAAI